jgi:hypothetical protein
VEHRFPSGVTCNTKHFKNKAAPDNRLKNNKWFCEITVVPGAQKGDPPVETAIVPLLSFGG